jgi:CO/xanthine dehydrogenase Mo-binding subunit
MCRAPHHVAFVYESIIDEISEKISMDPMDLRIKKCHKRGDTTD